MKTNNKSKEPVSANPSGQRVEQRLAEAKEKARLAKEAVRAAKRKVKDLKKAAKQAKREARKTKHSLALAIKALRTPFTKPAGSTRKPTANKLSTKPATSSRRKPASTKTPPRCGHRLLARKISRPAKQSTQKLVKRKTDKPASKSAPTFSPTLPNVKTAPAQRGLASAGVTGSEKLQIHVPRDFEPKASNSPASPVAPSSATEIPPRQGISSTEMPGSR